MSAVKVLIGATKVPVSAEEVLPECYKSAKKCQSKFGKMLAGSPPSVGKQTLAV